MGSDGLALVGRKAEKAGAFDPRLGEVYHAALDADFRGFVDDLRDYASVARRVSVAVNMEDSTWRLSQTINRGSRAGRPDIAELSPNARRWLLEASTTHGLEIVKVRPANIPGLSERSHTFWYNDPWVSSDVLITFLFHLPPQAHGLEREKLDAGGQVWTFPPDYMERLPGAMADLRERAGVLERSEASVP